MQYFKFFHDYFICYGNLWLVISGVPTVIIFGHQESHPFMTVNLVDKCCICSDCSTNWLLPSSLPLLRPPYCRRHNNIEIRPINNMTMTFKCSSERKSSTSLTLSQKLQIIKISEEDKSIPNTGWKLGLLHQLAKLWKQRKSSCRK